MNSQQLYEVKEVRALLAYHQILGIDYYPQEAGRLHFQEATFKPSVKVEKRMTPQPESRPKTSVSVLETLADIDREIQGCQNCELHAKRVVPVAGQGNPKARLLIVGGWLNLPEEQSTASSELLFGLEEDRMVARMLTAIHIDRQDAFVTNILKCAFPVSSQPVANHMQCCIAYLRRQIAVIAPEVICTMGIIATRALLNLPQSLSQLRGRFHPYAALDGRQIQDMPTYHPSYLIQAEEMKKETWNDLQLIEKKLAR